MKIRRFHMALGLSAAALMALSAPLSAMAQGYGGGPNYNNNYNTPPRPQPFNQPPPNLDDYLSRARTQAQSDYNRDYGNWQSSRDTANRAIADWDARYSRPPAPPRVVTPVPTGPAPASVNCQRRDNNTVTGGLLGALVGAAIGSNLAAKNTRTEGAVLGGVAGAALAARNNTSCDAQGYYWSYDQTYAYQEPTTYRGRNSGAHNYDYYVREKCRLALAPDTGNDYRYVRVCPDGENRYRITN